MLRAVARMATVALLAAAAVAPAAAADQSLRATGSITYTWQGSPSQGCAAIGVCDVQGALIIEAQGIADVQELGKQTIISLGGSPATVRVLTGSGQHQGECVDAPTGPPGITVFVNRSAGRLVGTIQPPLSSGRCAGPLASELRGLTLPVRRSPGTHPSFDLRASRAFTAGPFAGTLVSTVTMRRAIGLGASSFSSSSGPPPPGRQKILIEHVKLRYRVSGRSEPLVASFAGESDPFCAVLDACGATGTLALSAPEFSGTLTLTGSRQVARRETSQQVIADLRRGRITVFGGVSSRLLTSETFVRADGSRCQDSTTTASLLAIGAVPPIGKVSAEVSQTFIDADGLRTHCPGPAYTDVFGSADTLPVIRGPVSVAQLLAPHGTLTVSDPGGFGGLGYVGSRSGAMAFSLSLERVRAGTSEETR